MRLRETNELVHGGPIKDVSRSSNGLRVWFSVSFVAIKDDY